MKLHQKNDECQTACTSFTLSVGNAHIVAESAGSGQPVVFLHAAIADRRMWRHQITVLSSRYQAIAFDRRGFGESPAVDEAYSPTTDLLAVLDRLVEPGVPVVLVGCSQGGSIAIDTALAAPDRISALILISPSVSASPASIPHEAAGRLLDAIKIAGQAGDLDEVNRLKAALFLDGPLEKEGRVGGPTRQLFLEMNRIALPNQGVGSMLSPLTPAWERLNEIKIPVRILCGDLDVPHIQARCQKLAETLPNARFEVFPGAAHLPSLEQPKNLTIRLLNLLASF